MKEINDFIKKAEKFLKTAETTDAEGITANIRVMEAESEGLPEDIVGESDED